MPDIPATDAIMRGLHKDVLSTSNTPLTPGRSTETRDTVEILGPKALPLGPRPDLK